MSELENRLDDLMRDRELTLTELSEMTEMKPPEGKRTKRHRKENGRCRRLL